MKQTSGNSIPEQYQTAMETALWKMGDAAKHLWTLNAEWNPDKVVELKYNGVKITIEKT